MYLGTIALFPPHQQEPKKKTDDYITHGQEKGKKKEQSSRTIHAYTTTNTTHAWCHFLAAASNLPFCLPLHPYVSSHIVFLSERSMGRIIRVLLLLTSFFAWTGLDPCRAD